MDFCRTILSPGYGEPRPGVRAFSSLACACFFKLFPAAIVVAVCFKADTFLLCAM